MRILDLVSAMILIKKENQRKIIYNYNMNNQKIQISTTNYQYSNSNKQNHNYVQFTKKTYKILMNIDQKINLKMKMKKNKN